MKKKVLIIIRGNSGSGKSTIAKELRQKMVDMGVKTALVEQDYLRRIVLKEKETQSENNIDLIEQTVKFALKRGYSVVLEGILFSKRYKKMIIRLTDDCNSYLYYMKVSFEETLKRHKTKVDTNEFGEKEMKLWWRDKDLLNFKNEKIIPEENSLEQSIEQILRDVGSGIT